MAVDFFQVGDLHFGVNLSGRQTAMSQDFLNIPDVGLALQQMSGAGMTQVMAGNVLFQSGFLAQTGN